MAVVTGQLVDTVLQRVRDPGGLAHSRVLVRLILTHLQRILNAKFGVVLESRTLATVPRQQVYPIIDEYFGPLKPCSTGLVVKGLALPELVMEIDAYGVIDD